MDNMEKNDIRHKMRKSLHPINIYNNLKSLYFAIIPKGSKLYNFTYGILHIFLKRLHLFNIYYQEWIRRFDTLSEQDLQDIREQISAMPQTPAISVVMPVYNPPVELLEEAIQSVLDQIYPHWELCIADDASTDENVIATLEKYSQQDERIQVVFRKENGHISAASNSALELVSNDYFALLDHDDMLHPLALFYAAKTIEEHPDSIIIYSDEDKITKRGRRLDPYFKPDFNYELLLSQNMISHLGVYQTAAVREVGGFRVGLEGSQDYDLALRVLDQCERHQIHHIPRPLYHWRIFRESAARDMNIKPYAIDAGIQALKDHLRRRSVNAQIKFMPELAAYSVFYELPKKKPGVDLVLLTDKIDNDLKETIQEIFDNTDYPNYKILIGYSAGSPLDISGFAEQIQSKTQIIPVREKKEHSFAKDFNQCLSSCKSEFICLLDKKLSGFKPGWVDDLLGQADQENIGAVAPKLIYQPSVRGNQKERVYSNGIVLLPDQNAYHLSQEHERTDNGYFGWGKLARGYSALSEKCLLFARDQFIYVDGFDEQLSTPLYCIINFCLKLRQLHLRNILRPSVELYIQEDSHYNNRLMEDTQIAQKDLAKLHERWEAWFNHDPAFNPHLTILDENKLLVDLVKESALLENR